MKAKYHGDLGLFATRLYARLGTGVVVERIGIQIGDWRPQLNRCHFNVSELIERAPEFTAVRGWIAASYDALGYMRFFAHSVAERPDGKLVDVTPNPTSWNYPFILHLEEDGDFVELVENCGVVHLDYAL